jgi:predicted dehydrogenase
MRFALFGDGPVALSLARAIALDPAHQLIRLVGEPGLAFGRAQTNFHGRYLRHWEELLTDAEVDAVIVFGEGAEAQQAVRQIAQSGKSVLFSAELLEQVEFFYELALVETEHPGQLFPLLVLRGHTLVLKLQELLARNALGEVRHLELHRQIVPSANGRTATLLTESDLTRPLLADADLLDALCGPYDQVTASRSGNAGEGYSLATVTLGGQSAPQALWTAAANTADHDWRLVLTAEAGIAVLEGNPEAGDLTLTVQRPGHPAESEESVADSGPWLLERFIASQAVASEDGLQAATPHAPAEAGTPAGHRRNHLPEIPLWTEFAHVIELVEAVERSVRRRRTIDVYFDPPSERGIFKTQMTAVGCSLLVLTLAAVVMYAVLEAAVNLAPPLRRVLVTLIFVPLLVFLALQLLVFVTRPGTRHGQSDG